MSDDLYALTGHDVDRLSRLLEANEGGARMKQADTARRPAFPPAIETFIALTTATIPARDITITTLATLVGALGENETNIPVSSTAAMPLGRMFVVTINNEDMLVTAVSSGYLKVSRGINGTTPSAHPDGALVERERVILGSGPVTLYAAVQQSDGNWDLEDSYVTETAYNPCAELIPDDTLVHLYREPRSGKLMALELCTMPFIHGPSGSGGSGNPGFGPCGTCDGAVAETYCITDWGVCTGGDYGQPMMPSGPCEWTLEIPNPLGPGILYRLVFSLALQPQFYVWFEQTVPPRLLQYYTGSATNCMNPMVLNSVYFSEGPCNVSTITIEPCAGGGGGGGAAWLDTFTDSDGTDLIDHTPDSPLAGVYTAGTTSPIDIQSNRIIYAGSGAGDPASRYFDPGLTETVTIVEVCANRALADLVGKAVHFGVIVRGSTASNFCQNGYYCSLFVNATAGPVLDALIIIYRYDAGTSSFVQSTAVTINTTLVYSLRVTNSTTFVKLELLDVDGTTVLATLTETAGTYFGNTEIGLGFSPLFAPDANGDPFMDNLTVDQL